MDFGLVGLEGGGLVSTLASSNGDVEANKQKWYRSDFLKQERLRTDSEDDWREFKVGKTSADFSLSKAMLLQQKSHLSEGQQQQQMLSFSSPNSQSVTLPYYTSTAYNRNAGYGNGGLNGGNMLNGFRGPFAPSQWVELELQALIYKYITSNVPIPSYLLNPIRKALDSAGLSSFPGFRSNTSMGWGGFHLGFANNTDPEPGRCRRTDGKKWRCSRDAVVDQKYCERHINRGRHRSRKPVEGQPGTTSSTSKPPVASTTPPAAAVVLPGGGGASNNRGHLHHQTNTNLSASGTNPSVSHQFDRNLLDKANDLSLLSPTVSLKDPYSFSKQQNPSEEAAHGEFGIVYSDSLLNPLNKSSSFDDRDSKSHNPLRQFMDDWPRNQSENSAISWSNIDVHSERTLLSISTPMATSDYLSATSSPNNEKLTASPLRLLLELEATQMGLGVGTLANDQNNRQANWIPISWQSSMGGPLGEVLHSKNATADYKNTSALNLMTEGWDNSPQMAASSPTNVLHKTSFGSLSNSSTGSSPRPENNKSREGAAICNDLLGPTLQHPSLPTL